MKQKLRAIIKEIEINENVCAKKQAGKFDRYKPKITVTETVNFSISSKARPMLRQAQQTSCKNLRDTRKKAQKNPCQNDKGDGQKLS